MSELSHCPSCSNKIQGLLTLNSMIDDNKIHLVNSILETNESKRCAKCISPFLEKVRAKIHAQKPHRIQEVKSGLEKLPVATIQVPPKWDFDVMSIVSGQSVTGTGIFAEVFSDFTDFFGAQSETYNNKLRNGELTCLSQLKLKTLELNGNAIVGIDIDYSEVGGSKGMLMVCMAGTAVNLKNMEEVQPGIFEQLNLAKTANKILSLFNKFEKAFDSAGF